MNCPSCGKALVPGKKFCGGCGTTVSASPETAAPVEAAPAGAAGPTCHKCSKALVPGKKFCGGCGETVPTGVTSTPSSPTLSSTPAPSSKDPTCSACGVKLDPTRRFCGGCGAPHKDGRTTVTSAPAPEPVSKTQLNFGAQGHVKKDVTAVGGKIRVPTCPKCAQLAYETESLKFGEDWYHESCFKCLECACILTIARATLIDNQGLFCTTCAKPRLLAKGLEKSKNVNLDLGTSLTTVAKNQCPVCGTTAYEAEAFKYNDRMYHYACFKCSECAAVLDQRTVNQEEDDKSGPIWCKQCFHKNIIAKKKVTANTAKTTTSNPLAAKFGTNQKCPQCEKTAYKEESESLNGVLYHKACLNCKRCSCSLNLRQLVVFETLLYCKNCQVHLVAFAKIDMEKHPKAFEEHMRAAGIHDYTAKGGTGTVVAATLPSNATEKPAPQPKVQTEPMPLPVSVYKSEKTDAPPAIQKQRSEVNKINSPFLQRDQGLPVSEPAEPKPAPKKAELAKQGSVSHIEEASGGSCGECGEEYDPPNAKFCMVCGTPRTDAPAASKAAGKAEPAKAADKPAAKKEVPSSTGDKPPPMRQPTQSELDARPKYEGKIDGNKQGLLVKAKAAKQRDVVRGGWQPRFFILSESDKTLAYFTGGGAYGPPAGIINLTDAECAMTMAVQKKICLRLVEKGSPVKFYYIAAESERSRDDWVSSINHVINK